MDSSLINVTLLEIAGGYRPGLLAWVKGQPRGWEKMLSLEEAINKATLAGDDAGLKVALAAYKTFFQEMTELYRKAEQMPLFGGRRHG